MKSLITKFFITSILLFFFANSIKAQTPTVQDCLGAIPICGSVYYEENAYMGTGNYPAEINNGISCLGSGEKNCVWYIFTVQISGNLDFSITPNDMSDDYDWAVYNLTNNECWEIYSNPALEVSCNYSGAPGVTGANGLSGSQNEPVVPVIAGQTYVMNVSQFSPSTNGYTLDLGESTAVFYDDVEPYATELTPAAFCDSAAINCHFSEGIVCSTVAVEDFELVGPGGPFTITSVTSESCNLGGSYDNNFRITFTPELQMGSYTLNIVPHTEGSLTDNCGNSAEIGALEFDTQNSFDLAYSTVDPTCFGYTDGIIDASLPGASGTILYSLDGGTFLDNGGLYTGLPAGTYTVMARNDNMCWAEAEIEIEEPSVGTSDAGEDAVLCDDDFHTLQANNPGDGEGHWTWDQPGITITNEYFFWAVASNLPAGHTTFTWAVDHGVCGNYIDDVLITRYNTTTTAGPDDNICGNEITLTANNPFPGFGEWTCTTGGLTYENQTYYNTQVTGIPAGTHTFTWTADYADCGTFADDVTITTTTNPVTANAGNDDRICNISDFELGLPNGATEPPLGSGVWTCSHPEVAFDNSATLTTWARNIPEGEIVFTWTVTDGNCSTSDEIVLINGTETLANANDDISICNDETFQLSGSEPVIGYGYWQASNLAVNFDDISVFDATVTDLPYGETTFTWTISEGVCSTSDQMILTRNEPIPAEPGTDFQVCENFTQLPATAPASGYGYWETTTPLANFDDISLHNSTISNLAFGNNELTWTVVNGACRDTQTLNVERRASIPANANVDTTMCNPASYQFEGNIPLPGYGVWETDGVGVTFTNVSSYDAVAQNIPTGTTMFVWKITNGICISRDTMYITNDELILAEAGDDINICDSVYVLQGNTPTSGDAFWETPSPGVTFDNPTFPNAEVEHLNPGTNVFTWSITNGTCSHSDVVLITRDDEIEATADNVLICEETTEVTLNGNDPFPGTGYWNAADPAITFDNQSINNATVSNLAEGDNMLSWTIVNGTCSNTVEIVVQQDTVIHADAGVDTSFCATAFNLYGNQPAEGYGFWTTESIASFSNASTHSPEVYDLPFGETTFTWTIVNGACQDTDEMTVMQYEEIQAEANEDQHFCEQATFTFEANEATSGYGFWNTAEVIVSFDNQSIHNATASNLPYGETVFLWTIVNGKCQTSDQITITRDSLIEALAGENVQECDITTYTLAGNSAEPGLGIWESSQTGLSFDNENSPTATISNLTTGTTTLTWTIYNGLCESQSSIDIEVNTSPVVDLGDDVDICEGESHFFRAGSGYENYLWNTNETDSIIIASETGNYSVTITNICGEVSDEVMLTVNPLPEISAGADTAVCSGEPVMLNATGNGQISWSNGGVQNTEFTPESTQTFVATVISAENCENTDEVTITVNPNPEITQVDTTVSGTLSLETFSTSEPLQYSLNGETNSTGTFSGLETGDYELIITDQNGCMLKTEMYIFVEVPIIIPDIFTPNGDGINDTWQIEGLYQFPKAQINIFDRYGKTIASYTATDPAWDGTYMGKPVEPNTYWYLIEFRDRHYKGSVTIKR